MKSLTGAPVVVDAERFIAIMNRDKLDYDKWREVYFSSMTTAEYEQALHDFSHNKRPTK